MHVGIIAARTTVAQLRDAFLRTRPNYELGASHGPFATFEEAEAWRDANAQPVPANQWSKCNPGTSVYLLWQDGPWAVLADSSYVDASDEDANAILSRGFDPVLSFVVESASGCASFSAFADGRLVRNINFNDGECDQRGDPLPQEQGINVAGLYMAESEALAAAFGLTALAEHPRRDHIHAVCVIDRTDYSNVPSNPFMPAPVKPSVQTRPWWKFW